ncbi:MAG: hypothetical protein E4G95_09265 [Bacteroidia bacterium]|nr:MAG: hypothetical protein E4G95_09265 [Bacteroidia bacterium]
MGFASAYLGSMTLASALVEEEPHTDTGIILIVPSFDEPDIVSLLNSLVKCQQPGCKVEVLIGINAPPEASERQLEQNNLTIRDIESWRDANMNAPFRLFFFDTGRSRDRGWGAGLARKILMDEALRRFNIIDNPGGIIVSLDADCTVSSNYLTAIKDHFSAQPGINGASIRFEHVIPGSKDHPALRNAIISYELHMRYYYQALSYSGYPQVFHTIGSALAARASAYASVGGMNRRQAGEDFYFIQKMIPLGGFIAINSAVVYPSARISDRVPFGTGPAVRAIIENPDQQLLTYNPQAFIDLQRLVKRVPDFFDIGESQQGSIGDGLPAGIYDFLIANDWLKKVDEIRSNTACRDSFIKRFYNWLNMFQLVKYLNFVHTGKYFEKMAVEDASRQMIKMITGNDNCKDRYELLEQYRMLER